MSRLTPTSMPYDFAHTSHESDARFSGGLDLTSNMERMEQIVGRLPEAIRVDIEAWGGEPSFRVAGKNFVFSNPEASTINVKLSIDEAAAVVATDPDASAAAYGLGRHGWISVTLGKRPSQARWREIEEWVRTSYTLVAPRKLAQQVLDSDNATP
jgi:predicted DNA-binding protein (MmcQ/YjbR family)